MRALWYLKPGELEWRDVPEPELDGPDAAIVRPLAVATCDLDGPIVRGEVPAPGPFPVGHEFVAEVVAVGASVTSVAADDRVSVPFQISCGQCPRCRAGLTADCRSVPAGSAYGMGPLSDGLRWAGAVADLVGVPYADAMCVPLPPGLDPAALAGLSDNLVDGWRTVGPYLGVATEPRVLVFGRGSIGLYATAIAAALGAEVSYVDPDPDRCRIAELVGASVIHEPPKERYRAHPLVVHTAGTPDALRSAIASTTSSGVCVDTGIIFDNETPLPLFNMYVKGITLVTGRVHARPAMPKVLDLVTSGRLDLAPMVRATAPWSDAVDAWAGHTGRLALVRDPL